MKCDFCGNEFDESKLYPTQYHSYCTRKNACQEDNCQNEQLEEDGKIVDVVKAYKKIW